MSGRNGFHPNLTRTKVEHVRTSLRARVHHVKAGELSSGTAQTEGMQRFAAVSGGSVGSEKIWMGETHVSPETMSDNDHHGESETAIFVRSGNPEFVFHTASEKSASRPHQATTSLFHRMFRTEKRIPTPTIPL